MCPEFKERVCEIAGIEPDKLKCTSEDCCLSDDWEYCKVYISQFFLAPDEKLAAVA